MQYSSDEKAADRATHVEHTGSRRTSVAHEGFNRRNSLADGGRRNSLSKNFDNANIAMVLNDKIHVEISDDVMEDSNIDNIAVSWFVWLVAATASIAGALFGYDTGIISAVLVYLGTDLGGGRETTSSEKEAITALCSAGAFVGAIIAGLTADKVIRNPVSSRSCFFTDNCSTVREENRNLRWMCTLYHRRRPAGRFLFNRSDVRWSVDCWIWCRICCHGKQCCRDCHGRTDELTISLGRPAVYR